MCNLISVDRRERLRIQLSSGTLIHKCSTCSNSNQAAYHDTDRSYQSPRNSVLDCGMQTKSCTLTLLRYQLDTRIMKNYYVSGIGEVVHKMFQRGTMPEVIVEYLCFN